MTSPATLSVPEAAQLLGVSRPTAYRWAAQGHLPTLRLGGRVLVLRQPLLALLAGVGGEAAGAAGGR